MSILGKLTGQGNKVRNWAQESGSLNTYTICSLFWKNRVRFCSQQKQLQLHFISEHNTVVPALLRSVPSLFLKIQDKRDSTEPRKSRSKLSLKGTCQKGSSKQQGHHFVQGIFQEVLVSKEKCPLGIMSKNIIAPFKLYVNSLGGSLCILEKKKTSQAATYVTRLFIYSVNS